MSEFKDHLKHSLNRHPEVPKETHISVHRWMDEPANWKTDFVYESGYVRRNGYNGYTHREIRHEPKKIANALSGGHKWKWEQVYKIAKAHTDLDSVTSPDFITLIKEAEYSEKFELSAPKKLVFTSVLKVTNFFKRS